MDPASMGSSRTLVFIPTIDPVANEPGHACTLKCPVRVVTICINATMVATLSTLVNVVTVLPVTFESEFTVAVVRSFSVVTVCICVTSVSSGDAFVVVFAKVVSISGESGLTSTHECSDDVCANCFLVT